MTQHGKQITQNDLQWAKNDPKLLKWPKNDILMSKSKKIGIPLFSTFDVEAPFQRYMPKNEILAKKWTENGPKMTF